MSKRTMKKVFNLHQFQIQVINQEPQESNNYFIEDMERLICLVQFAYFFQVELMILDCKNKNYFLDACSHNDFSKLEEISNLDI